MKIILLPLFGLLLIINGCSTMSASDKEQQRKQLDVMAGGTITRLIKQFPDLLSEIEDAPGYMVARITPPANAGEGVLIANGSEQRHYFTIGRLEMGSGWGTRSFKILLLLKTREMLDDFNDAMQKNKSDTVTDKQLSAATGNEYTVYVMSGSGVAVTAAVKIKDIKINDTLSEH